MVELSRPELPLSSAAIAEPTRHDPDQGGHFGVFGGRYVAEALMAVIEEVTAAYEKERVNPDFLETLDDLQANDSIVLVEWGEKFPSVVKRSQGEIVMKSLDAEGRRITLNMKPSPVVAGAKTP